MREQLIKELASALNDNLGNRITQALGVGILNNFVSVFDGLSAATTVDPESVEKPVESQVANS